MKANYCPACHGTGHVLDHKTIGRRMQAARHAKGVSLRVMAKRIGVSHSYLCLLEKGQRHWPWKLQNRFLGVLE